MPDPRLREAHEWDAQWSRWFTAYSTGRPRVAAWLAARHDIEGRAVLELGAGSGREARRLASLARRVVCVDFSELAVQMLSGSEAPENLCAVRADARALEFGDREFDLSFHKGFWSCFEDDADIRALIDEQLRVTGRTAIAIVHNVHNSAARRSFAVRRRSDFLYDVRFFDVDELLALGQDAVSRSLRRATIRVVGFGGPNWMHRRLWRSLPWTAQGHLANLAYRFTPLERAESLALEIRFEPGQEP